MYYIDRLHINHFSQTAMSLLLTQFELGIDSEGSHRFLYRDGCLSCHFCFASRGDRKYQLSPSWAEVALDGEFESYHTAEAERAAVLREKFLNHAALSAFLHMEL